MLTDEVFETFYFAYFMHKTSLRGNTYSILILKWKWNILKLTFKNREIWMVIYFFFFMLFTEHKVFFVPFCKFQEGLINKFIGDLKHYFNNYILKLNVDMTIECRIAMLRPHSFCAGKTINFIMKFEVIHRLFLIMISIIMFLRNMKKCCIHS